MRIFDDDNDAAINEVLLLLKESEAKELMFALQDLLSHSGQDTHVHINDSDYRRKITVALYDDENIEKNTFNKRVMELIWEDK